MKTILKTNITVEDICDGFIYNELEGKGLFGLSGKLTIQPQCPRSSRIANTVGIGYSSQHKRSQAILGEISREVKYVLDRFDRWIVYRSQYRVSNCLLLHIS